MKQTSVLLKGINKESTFKQNTTQKLEVISWFVSLLRKELDVPSSDYFPRKHTMSHTGI